MKTYEALFVPRENTGRDYSDRFTLRFSADAGDPNQTLRDLQFEFGREFQISIMCRMVHDNTVTLADAARNIIAIIDKHN